MTERSGDMAVALEPVVGWPEPLWLDTAVAVCPICGGKLHVEVQEIETETGKPLSIDLSCEREPDIESDEWDEWFNGHYSMPYVDWLPVETHVLRWMRRQTPNSELTRDDARRAEDSRGVPG